MKHVSRQPVITVGITASAEAELTPVGNWNIINNDNSKEYIPLDSDAFMVVSGVLIGKGFHWQQHRTFKYKGSFTATCHGNAVTHIINYVPLEQYLQSVVASEMNAKAPAEFIKAHAIISRSWAMRKMLVKESLSPGKTVTADRIITWQENDSHTGFHVCSDDHCQRYQGIPDTDTATNAIAKCVRTTQGIVLTDADSNIADTRFSKCCGGTTELFSTCWAEKDFPYLTPLSDPYCNPARISEKERNKLLKTILNDYDLGTDYYRWQSFVSNRKIETNLHTLYSIDKGRVTDLHILQRGPSGRIKTLAILCEKGTVTVGKELLIRRLLSDSHLYSSAFSIEKADDGFKLHGRGWGHGVGLCQIGAAVMAYEGKTAEEILKFYFPGTTLNNFY